MDNLRTRLRQWMVDAMAERCWSAERWGREANTAATNITRFLKSDKAAIPNSRTIDKLADAIGIPAPVGGMKKFAVNSVPILDAITVKMVHFPATLQDRKSLMMKSVGNLLAPHEVSSSAFAVEAPSNRLAALGVMIGDMLVIEPDGEQAAGAKMLYRISDRIDVGVLERGTLSPRSFDAEPSVRIEDVQLVGRIVSVVKKM
jgi:hypothetical protein